MCSVYVHATKSTVGNKRGKIFLNEPVRDGGKTCVRFRHERQSRCRSCAITRMQSPPYPLAARLLSDDHSELDHKLREQPSDTVAHVWAQARLRVPGLAEETDDPAIQITGER